MANITVKVEISVDGNVITDYYTIDTAKLGDLNPLDELKTLETLVKALRIFDGTTLYDVIGKGIEFRLARMLAYYQDKLRPKILTSNKD
jgi:hypothetical protein